MKASELIGPQLDWAVAKCEGHQPECHDDYTLREELQGIRRHRISVSTEYYDNGNDYQPTYSPSTDWAQGGPIIEREEIFISRFHDYPRWTADHPKGYECRQFGPTALIATMRCYIALKMGDEIEIPEELK